MMFDEQFLQLMDEIKKTWTKMQGKIAKIVGQKLKADCEYTFARKITKNLDTNKCTYSEILGGSNQRHNHCRYSS